MFLENAEKEFYHNFACLLQKEMLTTLPIAYRDRFILDFSGVLNMSMPSMNAFLMRELAIPHMGYTVITKEFCSALSTFIGNHSVLEVMAGNGLLTYGLRQYGVTSHATDDQSWHTSFNMWIDDLEVLDGVSAIEKYGHNVDYIIVAWPPMDSVIEDIVTAIKKLNRPELRLIYIGESCGGCTATEKFFDMVEEIQDATFDTVVQHYHS